MYDKLYFDNCAPSDYHAPSNYRMPITFDRIKKEFYDDLDQKSKKVINKIQRKRIGFHLPYEIYKKIHPVIAIPFLYDKYFKFDAKYKKIYHEMKDYRSVNRHKTFLDMFKDPKYLKQINLKEYCSTIINDYMDHFVDRYPEANNNVIRDYMNKFPDNKTFLSMYKTLSNDKLDWLVPRNNDQVSIMLFIVYMLSAFLYAEYNHDEGDDRSFIRYRYDKDSLREFLYDNLGRSGLTNFCSQLKHLYNDNSILATRIFQNILFDYPSFPTISIIMNQLADLQTMTIKRKIHKFNNHLHTDFKHKYIYALDNSLEFIQYMLDVSNSVNAFTPIWSECMSVINSSNAKTWIKILIPYEICCEVGEQEICQTYYGGFINMFYQKCMNKSSLSDIKKEQKIIKNRWKFLINDAANSDNDEIFKFKQLNKIDTTNDILCVGWSENFIYTLSNYNGEEKINKIEIKRR